jgi:hypothetical protein
LTGDVGGFGVGSDFSWQVVGAYSWDFATTGATTWAGVIGYRALSVDYTKAPASGNMDMIFSSTVQSSGSA